MILNSMCSFVFLINVVFLPGNDDFHFGDRFWHHGLLSKGQGRHEIKIILKNPLYVTPQYFNISTLVTVFALKGVGL